MSLGDGVRPYTVQEGIGDARTKSGHHHETYARSSLCEDKQECGLQDKKDDMSTVSS